MNQILALREKREEGPCKAPPRLEYAAYLRRPSFSISAR